MNRILIVEDEDRIASFVAKGLKAEGFTPTVVGDGITGLDYALTGEFDLMVLDIGLPGMDGYEVARHLRAEDGVREATIIAITGYGEEQALRRSREAGFDHHLVKPVDYERLLDLLLQLGEPEAARKSTSLA